MPNPNEPDFQILIEIAFRSFVDGLIIYLNQNTDPDFQVSTSIFSILLGSATKTWDTRRTKTSPCHTTVLTVSRLCIPPQQALNAGTRFQLPIADRSTKTEENSRERRLLMENESYFGNPPPPKERKGQLTSLSVDNLKKCVPDARKNRDHPFLHPPRLRLRLLLR